MNFERILQNSFLKIIKIIFHLNYFQVKNTDYQNVSIFAAKMYSLILVFGVKIQTVTYELILFMWLFKDCVTHNYFKKVTLWRKNMCPKSKYQSKSPFGNSTEDILMKYLKYVLRIFNIDFLSNQSPTPGSSKTLSETQTQIHP